MKSFKNCVGERVQRAARRRFSPRVGRARPPPSAGRSVGGVGPPSISETRGRAPAPTVMPGAALPAVLLPLLGLAAAAVAGKTPPLRRPLLAPGPAETLHHPSPTCPWAPRGPRPAPASLPPCAPTPCAPAGGLQFSGFQEGARGKRSPSSREFPLPPEKCKRQRKPHSVRGGPPRGLSGWRAGGRGYTARTVSAPLGAAMGKLAAEVSPAVRRGVGGGGGRKQALICSPRCLSSWLMFKLLQQENSAAR